MTINIRLPPVHNGTKVIVSNNSGMPFCICDNGEILDFGETMKMTINIGDAIKSLELAIEALQRKLQGEGHIKGYYAHYKNVAIKIAEIEELTTE